MGGSDDTGDGLASPVATGCQGNPCSTGIRSGVSPAAQMGCLRNRSEPTRGRPAVRGKGTDGGRSGQRVEEEGTWASAHENTARQVMDGLRTEICGQQKQSNEPRNNQHILNTPATGRRYPQTAHPATSSTAPAHQILGSANAEMTPAGAPAAAADRKQQPDATCEGKNR